MSISIRQATPEDAGAIIDCAMLAFQNDHMSNQYFYLDVATPQQLAEYRNWRVSLAKLRMDGEGGKYWFKAVDDSNGSIVGFCGLFAPDVEPPAHASAAVPLPALMNHDLDREFRELLETTKKKWIGGRDDVWFVQSMAVHPQYQGRSIARRLLERGLEEADRRGQDTYIEATEAGQPLYRRCGFEELEPLMLTSIGYPLMVMIRHAPSRSDEN